MGVKLKNRIALVAALFSKKIGLLNALKNRNPHPPRARALPAPYRKQRLDFVRKSPHQRAIDLGMTKREFQHSQSPRREGVGKKMLHRDVSSGMLKIGPSPSLPCLAFGAPRWTHRGPPNPTSVHSYIVVCWVVGWEEREEGEEREEREDGREGREVSA